MKKIRSDKKILLTLFSAIVALSLILSACDGTSGAGKEDPVTDAPPEVTKMPLETAEPHESKENAMGFTVNESGAVLLAGKPFYGFGVNVFSLVTREVETGTSDYRNQLDLLKECGIPFIRINLGGFWKSYYEQYDRNPAEMIAKIREIVDYAEEKQIGLVCSLLWFNAAIPDHVGEKRASIGDPDSETVKYTKKYVAEIVNAFKDSPAVWAWEIGNEYNLDADLCDPEFKNWLPIGYEDPEKANGFDYYTSGEMQYYLAEVASVIRENDPDRMISSGNSEMRSYSGALHAAGLKADPVTHVWEMAWDTDSEQDFLYMNSFMAPNPIDCLSFHLQLCGYNENGEAEYIRSLARFGKSDISPREYFDAYARVAKKLKKAAFFGEFGDYLDLEADERTPGEFKELLSWISDAGIQIACSWQFSAKSLYVTTDGNDGKKLESIREANEAFQAAGKQDAGLYWSRY